VLGVTIVSLFTTATTSSATPNDARRAAYVTESATRYAFSELRNSGFATGVVNALNTTTYNLDPVGSFTFNIFGPWFKANETKAISDETEPKTIQLKVPVGTPPAEWVAQNTGNLWMVNYDYLDLGLAKARDGIKSWTPDVDDPTILTITTNGDFVANQGERVCLAVKLSSSQSIADGEDLYVTTVAKDFFPGYGGVININRIDYVYKRLVYEPDNNRVKLEHITAAGLPNAESASAFPLDLNINQDFIVLSPRNYFVIPTGTANTVTVAGNLDRALNIYNSTNGGVGVTGNPDIDFNQFNLDDDLNAIGTTGYVSVEDDAKKIEIGRAPVANQVDFGGIWFNKDMTIGGKAQVCSSGKCEFGGGVRVFFKLVYEGTADGLTFALINGANNETSSIGGDIEMGELLGYGGDSRNKVIPPDSTATTADFLDGTGKGLQHPKIALEFDTYNNNPNEVSCDGDTIKDNSRNDPFPVKREKDALQFVFWGSTSLPTQLPCRDYTIDLIDFEDHPTEDHPTYDDNRHGVGPLSTRNIKDKVVIVKDGVVTSFPGGTGTDSGGVSREGVSVSNELDWLNEGPWAVRLEVMRSPPDPMDPDAVSYTLHAWILQCTIEDTEDCANISGTFYEDTRIQYSATPHLAQTIELTETEHLDFDTFIFGFTGATGPSKTQTAEITDVKLSFIRFNDPIAP